MSRVTGILECVISSAIKWTFEVKVSHTIF